MNKLKNILLFVFAFGLITGCDLLQKTESLPYLGFHDIQGDDTIALHRIPDFRFQNQDSVWITNETYKDKVYISEFFFTYCPTICPTVKQNLMRLSSRFENDDRVMILGHAIDYKRDTIPRLKEYADLMGIEGPRWSLVWGPPEDIYTIDSAYLSIAMENSDAPGGFDHSGLLVMVDKNRHVRSYCYGTDAEAVDKFMDEIDQLLREEY